MRIQKLIKTTLLPLLFLMVTAVTAYAGNLDPWHWRNPLPQGHTLRGEVYGNGQFVALGDGGTILTSTDGASWMMQTSGTTSTLNGVASGAGIFVAVGAGGTIVTSTTGSTWTARTSRRSERSCPRPL